MAIISENETSTDAAAGIETTYTITGGDTFHGTLSDLDDVDYIKLDIDRGVEYEVHLTFHDLIREQFNVLGDLYVAGHLSVLDHQGNRLDFLGVSTSPDSPGLIFASNVMQAAGVVGLTGPSTTDIPVVIFNSGARGLSGFSDTMGDGWVQHPDHLSDGNLALSDVDARVRFTALYDFNYHVSISWSFSSESTILPFDPMTYTLTVEIHDQLPATPLSEFEDIPFFESFSLATNAANSDSFITDGTLYGRFQTYFLGVYSMVLTGTGGDDFLRTLEGNDFIYALSGNDVLFGGEGNDNLYGGPGNDLLAGGDGADTLDGGAGTDRLSYGSSDAAVTVNLADGTASGGHATGDTLTSIESLAGSRHHDVLTGDAGANRLTGGPGNDRLTGGAGADSLEGEVGTDTAVYAASAAAVIINLSDGTATGGDAQGDTLDSIENLIGSAHADTLTGNAGNNVLEGGGGADTLDGGDGADAAGYYSSAAGVTIDLSAAPDANGYIRGAGGDAEGDRLKNIERLWGSDYSDSLTGDAHDNVLGGWDGDDTLNGGDGDDTLDGGPGADTLDGGDGADTIVYWSSAAGVTIDLSAAPDANGYIRGAGGDAEGDKLKNIGNLQGSDYSDVLTGDGNDNVLDGRGDDDRLEGGPGADTLDGGDGTDTIYYRSSAAGVTIDLSAPPDANGYIRGAGGDAEGDRLKNIERLWGSDYSDVLTGDDNDNVLRGWDGDDTLSGGLGDDQIYGGPGDDRLTGESGENQFVFYAGSGNDVITDFALGFDKIAIVQPSIAFTDLRIDANGGDARVSWGDEGQSITLTGIADTALTEGSFQFGILIGKESGDTLIGSTGDDTLDGGDGGDTLDGLDGDDTLVGGPGDDWLSGGAGEDWFIFGAGSGNDIITDFEPGVDGIQIGQPNITFANLRQSESIGRERVVISWGDEGQSITLTGVPTALTESSFLFGTFLIGTVSNDTLNGSTGDDMINGLHGNDILHGLGGNDALNGDFGDDQLYGGPGADTLDGGPGYDYAYYTNSNVGVLVRLHNARAVRYGDAEGDTLTDIEHLVGSSHNDTLAGDSGDNRLEGGDGNDVLYGGPGGGDDLMDGGNGDDRLFGGQGNDTLTGGEGYDYLKGGTGEDVLIVDGDDMDALYGGPGRDTFQFFPTNLGGGSIGDFSNGEDVIDLTAFTDIDSMDDLDIVSHGDNVRIKLSGSDYLTTIVLSGFDINNLDNSDFLF